MLNRLLRSARNGYGELPLSHLEGSLDMGREVVQTALALLPEIHVSPLTEGAHAHTEGGAPSPLVRLLPSIRRTVTLGFHGPSAEKVAEQSPLVAMLLKTSKSTNGAHKCNLVHAAAELGLDAHAAHAELLGMARAQRMGVELADAAFYAKVLFYSLGSPDSFD